METINLAVRGFETVSDTFVFHVRAIRPCKVGQPGASLLYDEPHPGVVVVGFWSAKLSRLAPTMIICKQDVEVPIGIQLHPFCVHWFEKGVQAYNVETLRKAAMSCKS